MKLSSLMRTENIIIKSKATSKKEAIDEMFELLASKYKLELSGAGDVEKAVLERESLGGTVFPTGIAIPHARLDGFDDLIVSVLIPESPIRCDNVDVKIFILIFTSKTVSNTYLNMLATFIRISRDKELFSEWISCESAKEMMNFFDSHNISIKKDVTVEDIMSSNVISVGKESTLRELIDIFYKYNFGFLPVVDEDGIFIGEVDLITIMKESIPDYASQIKNLKFMKSFEPLERLFRKEDEIKVAELMTPPTVTFTSDVLLLEAVLDFITKGRRQIPVVENKKVIGIVSLKDILQKVLRG